MMICPINEDKCDFKLEKMKKMDTKDIEQIGSFLIKSFPHMKKIIPIWKSYIKSHGENIVLKDSKSKIRGFLNIEIDQNIGNINFIAVDPSLQGKSIGSQLLSFAEKKLSNTNVSELKLHTEGNRMKNLKFYRKNGWNVYSIDQNGYEHTTSVEFRKKIN